MHICIGGDLDGRVVEIEKTRFNASEINEGKRSDYVRQKYLIHGKIFHFWRHKEMPLWEMTKQIELIQYRKLIRSVPIHR